MESMSYSLYCMAVFGIFCSKNALWMISKKILLDLIQHKNDYFGVNTLKAIDIPSSKFTSQTNKKHD